MHASMKWIAGLLLCAFTVDAAANAATPELIATKAGCLACHAVDKKLFGPSYHEIAAKYKGDANAPAVLAAKVRKGGTGVWGKAMMFPVSAKKITDADLDDVIAWILTR
jgi:cytochrome c